MNQSEYQKFYARAVLVFPAIAEFFGRSAESAGLENPDALHAEWLASLRFVEASDADAAVTAMRDGDAEKPGRFWTDWQEFPAFVRRWCREHQAANRRAVEPEWRKPAPPRPTRTEGGLTDSVGLMRALIGKTPAEAQAALAEHFPPTDPDKQPRYRCLYCRDDSAGLVRVWRQWVVLYFRRYWAEEVPPDWRETLTAAMRKNRVGTHLSVYHVCCCDSYAARIKRDAASLSDTDRRHCRTPLFEARTHPAFGDGDPERLRAFVAEHAAEVATVSAYDFWGDETEEF